MDDQAFPEVSRLHQKSSRRPRLLTYFAIFLILLGAAIFAGARLLGTTTEDAGNPEPTIEPTAVVLPTDTLTPTEAQNVTPSPTIKAGTKTPTPGKTTPSPTTKAGSSTSLDRSALNIQVQNGSGVSGAAGTMANALRDLGYTIAGTGNADNYDYTDVTIQVKSSQAKYLDQLKKDLSSDYTIGDATSDLPASASYDALVIVGK